MTRAFVIFAILLAIVGTVSLTLALIGSSGTETFITNGVRTDVSHHYVGSVMPAILAFCLAALAGLGALLSRFLPGK